MTADMPPLANLFTDLGDTVILFLRIVLALAGAFVGWLVMSPLAKGVCRLAFRRPIPPAALTLSRLSGAVLLALALFYFFPLGRGGGGSGGGQGEGIGTGRGGPGGPGDKGGKAGKELEASPGEPGETAHVEMVLSNQYKKDSRWYLIEDKPPPKTLKEVDQYLHKHKDRLRYLDIIIYGNSVEPDHYAVQDLMNLAESKYKLRVYRPKAYWSKKKAEPPE
jgi:hypothetical protein